MKVECPTKVLAEALKRSGATTGGETAPILGCVVLEAQGKTLKLTSANFYSQTQIEIDVEVKEEGGCAVPLDKLRDLVSRFDREVTSLATTDSGGLKIQSGRGKYDLRTLEIDEFPQAEMIGNTTSLSFAKGSDLVALFSPVIHAVAEHQLDLVGLVGVRLHERDGRLVAAATDKHNFGRMILDIEGVPPGFGCVLSAESVNSILSTLRKMGEQPVTLEVAERLARLTCDRYVYTARVLPNKYPDYERILPDLSSPPTFCVEATSLLSSIERARCIIPNDKNRPQCARFIVEDGVARITYTGEDGHQGEEEIETTEVGEDRRAIMHLPCLVGSVGVWGDAMIECRLTSERYFVITSPSAPDCLQITMAQIRG